MQTVRPAGLRHAVVVIPTSASEFGVVGNGTKAQRNEPPRSSGGNGGSATRGTVSRHATEGTPLMHGDVIPGSRSSTPRAGGPVDKQSGLGHRADGGLPHEARARRPPHVTPPLQALQASQIGQLILRVVDPTFILTVPMHPVIPNARAFGIGVRCGSPGRPRGVGDRKGGRRHKLANHDGTRPRAQEQPHRRVGNKAAILNHRNASNGMGKALRDHKVVKAPGSAGGRRGRDNNPPNQPKPSRGRKHARSHVEVASQDPRPVQGREFAPEELKQLKVALGRALGVPGVHRGQVHAPPDVRSPPPDRAPRTVGWWEVVQRAARQAVVRPHGRGGASRVSISSRHRSRRRRQLPPDAGSIQLGLDDLPTRSTPELLDKARVSRGNRKVVMRGGPRIGVDCIHSPEPRPPVQLARLRDEGGRMVSRAIASPTVPPSAPTARGPRGLSIGTRVPKPPLCTIGLRMMSKATGNRQACLRLAAGSTHAAVMIMGIVVNHGVISARAEAKESKQADMDGGGKISHEVNVLRKANSGAGRTSRAASRHRGRTQVGAKVGVIPNPKLASSKHVSFSPPAKLPGSDESSIAVSHHRVCVDVHRGSNILLTRGAVPRVVSSQVVHAMSSIIMLLKSLSRRVIEGVTSCPTDGSLRFHTIGIVRRISLTSRGGQWRVVQRVRETVLLVLHAVYAIARLVFHAVKEFTQPLIVPHLGVHVLVIVGGAMMNDGLPRRWRGHTTRGTEVGGRDGVRSRRSRVGRLTDAAVRAGPA